MKEFKKKENLNIKQKDILKIATITLLAISLISSLGLLIYNILTLETVNFVEQIINNSLFILIVLFICASFIIVDYQKLFYLIASIFIIIFISFQLLVSNNIIKLPINEVIPDLTQMELNSVILWGQKNNIEITQELVYTDNYEINKVMGQNISSGKLLKNIRKINLIVSKGPNYNENVVLPIMIGWTIQDVLNYIDNNFLNNVLINYEIGEETKDTLINQSLKGIMKRNDKLVLTFSLGSKDSLTNINMIDLKNKSLFEATLWLKQNAINYKINYVFNEDIKRNYVISTDIALNEQLTPFETTINLTVSKGKEINVPNLINMNSEDIINWILENNLKIEFQESYHESIEKGKVIDSNFKENDKIEEGTTIIITTSKGSLKLEEFTSITDLREWANEYDITLNEVYEFNTTVSKGKIVSTDPKVGEVLKTNQVIKVVISNGKPISIPNFVGKTKTYISAKCSELKLSCSYKSSGYSTSYDANVATSQSKKAGTEVIEGSSLIIYLSLGAPKTYNFVIQDSWFQGISSYDASVSMLKAKFTSLAPGVTFTYVKKAHDSLPSGYIHPSSPIKGGTSISVKTGSNYTIWIVG